VWRNPNVNKDAQFVFKKKRRVAFCKISIIAYTYACSRLGELFWKDFLYNYRVLA